MGRCIIVWILIKFSLLTSGTRLGGVNGRHTSTKSSDDELSDCEDIRGDSSTFMI